MYNEDIGVLEDKVIKLREKLEDFEGILTKNGWKTENFNHLGTLRINLLVLYHAAEKLALTIQKDLRLKA